MSDHEPPESGQALRELEALMARLRAPDGCPWDREQTFRSLIPCTIEEVYEVVEAVEADDRPGLREELGDLLFHVIFYSQLAREEGAFSLAEVIAMVTAKMIRRHPHVFGPRKLETAQEVVQHWEAIKQEEKASSGPASLFDGLSSRLPALLWAYKVQQKMAKVGFDWPDAEGVLEKLAEELEELKTARLERNADAIEEEIGDLLFTAANLARHLGVHPESALRRATLKFMSRFRHIEQRLQADSRTVADTPLDHLEALWQESKAAEAGEAAQDTKPGRY